jgi:hypothetical protein
VFAEIAGEFAIALYEPLVGNAVLINGVTVPAVAFALETNPMIYVPDDS